MYTKSLRSVFSMLAVVGSQVANDFSLMTGYRLKIRNPSNAPDE